MRGRTSKTKIDTIYIFLFSIKKKKKTNNNGRTNEVRLLLLTDAAVFVLFISSARQFQEQNTTIYLLSTTKIHNTNNRTHTSSNLPSSLIVHTLLSKDSRQTCVLFPSQKWNSWTIESRPAVQTLPPSIHHVLPYRSTRHKKRRKKDDKIIHNNDETTLHNQSSAATNNTRCGLNYLWHQIKEVSPWLRWWEKIVEKSSLRPRRSDKGSNTADRKFLAVEDPQVGSPHLLHAVSSRTNGRRRRNETSLFQLAIDEIQAHRQVDRKMENHLYEPSNHIIWVRRLCRRCCTPSRAPWSWPAPRRIFLSCTSALAGQRPSTPNKGRTVVNWEEKQLHRFVLASSNKHPSHASAVSRLFPKRYRLDEAPTKLKIWSDRPWICKWLVKAAQLPAPSWNFFHQKKTAALLLHRWSNSLFHQVYLPP